MSEEKTTVEMTADEAARFEQFKAAEEKKQAADKRKQERETYRTMIDNEIETSIPELLSISEGIKTTKTTVLDNFRTILRMKEEMSMTKDDQRSHTFTNTKGDKRITLGVYTTDGYTDTVDVGIAMVRDYLESLAGDDKSKRSLVSMVLKLLARDAKGTLKASRVLQLRKLAEESGSDKFMEGVRIIEESYQPSISKQFIRAEVKNEHGAWVTIPLGMTEA